MGGGKRSIIYNHIQSHSGALKSDFHASMPDAAISLIFPSWPHFVFSLLQHEYANNTTGSVSDSSENVQVFHLLQS